MKKYAALLICSLFAGTSCQPESISDEVEPIGQTIQVSFQVALREEVTPFRQTRNIPEGLPSDPVASQAEEDEGNTGETTQPTTTLSWVEYALYSTDGELIRHIREEITLTPDGTASFSLEDKLTPGTYKACFLAHSVEDATFSEEDNLMTFPEIQDTFWGADEFEINAGEADASVPVTLTRAIAGIEFSPTDDVPAEVHHFHIETSGLYNTINLLDGTSSSASIEIPYTYTFTPEDKEEGKRVRQMIYSFVPAPEEEAESALIRTITLKAMQEDEELTPDPVRERTITNAPIYRNKITRYTGTLYTGGETLTDFILDLDTEWGETIEHPLDEIGE